MPRTPRIVALSVWFYRLLLAAYPPAFRKDYGEAMVQLYRDTALDGYRRRGTLGVLVLWPRTLVDIAVSVPRQHQEMAVATGSESLLLRDLLRQWGQLCSVALSVTSVSSWYFLHVLHLYFRRSALVWATLTVLAFGLWLGSFFQPIGTRINKLIRTSFHLTAGAVEINHYYLEGEPIPYDQWKKDATARWKTTQPDLPERVMSGPWPWELSFVSDIPGGIDVRHGPDLMPVLIQPYKSWRLRLPFLPVPLLLLWGALRARRRGQAAPGPALQSA
jgi:hypothetical protein